MARHEGAAISKGGKGQGEGRKITSASKSSRVNRTKPGCEDPDLGRMDGRVERVRGKPSEASSRGERARNEATAASVRA